MKARDGVTKLVSPPAAAVGVSLDAFDEVRSCELVS